MAKTATVDLISYMAKATDNSSVGAKSFSSKSSDFANVLNSANKTFNAQNDYSVSAKVQNSQSRTNTSQNSDKIGNNANSSKIADNSVQIQDSNNQSKNTKIDDNKTEDAPAKNEAQNTSKSHSQEDSQDPSSSSLASSTITVKNDSEESKKDKTNTGNGEQSTKDSTNEVNNTTAATIQATPVENMTALTQQTPQIETSTNDDSTKNLSTDSDTSEQPKNEIINTTTVNNSATEKIAATNDIMPVKTSKNTKGDEKNNSSNEQKTETKNAQQKENEIATSGTTVNETPVVTPVLTANAENIIGMLALNQQASNQNTNIDTTQNTTTSQLNEIQSNFGTDIKSTTDITTSIQPNTINIDASQINLKTTTNKLKQNEQDISLAQSAQNQESDAITEVSNMNDSDSVTSPSIKVNTEAIASNINANDTNANTKQNANEILKKTSLTQEALDKTNATVESVETSDLSSGTNHNSNQNSNGMKNNQNTEDQLVKLSLQGSSQSDIQNLATTQAGFGNTLDDMQSTITNQTPTQAQVHTQMPKEISNTEIMSQINNKLNNLSLKDETTSKVTIVLKPENLGKINLELINSKEGLTAQLTTNSSQVKEILDKSIDNLKDSLSSQGVNVNNVTVKVENAQKSSNDSLSFENQAGQSNQQQQQSDNANSSNKNETKFDNEMNNIISTNDLDSEPEETISEKQVSIGSPNGKVDYKI